MAHFINLMNKRYNAEQIRFYTPGYSGNTAIITITFLDAVEIGLNFDSSLKRDQYIADMDRKLGADNA